MYTQLYGTRGADPRGNRDIRFPTSYQEKLQTLEGWGGGGGVELE